MLSRTRSAAAALLVAGLLAAEPAAARPGDLSWFPMVTNVGDLNGDRRDDLVEIRTTSGSPSVQARSGRDGSRLWEHELPDGDVVGVHAMRVGEDARPGVVLDVELPGTKALLAIAGDGAIRWARFSPATALTEHVTVTLAATADDATDLVVWSEDLFDTRLLVVDGTDGSEREIGTARDGGNWPAVAMPGDLDGDRRSDVVTVRGATLDAVSSTGRTLWSHAVPRDAYAVWAVGDATGDGVPDVATGRYANETTLYDGRTGAARWRRPGWYAVALGDADGRRGTEVGVIDHLPDDRRSTFTATAYTASGRVLWRVKPAARGKAQPVHTWVRPLGDVDGDGAVDLGFRLVADTRYEGVVSGRTGRVRPDPARDLHPAGAIDSRGADLIGVTVKDRIATIVAWRGDRRARLWQVGLRDYYGHPAQVLAANLDGDRCADVVVSAPGSPRVHVAIAGATGRPLWGLHRDDGEITSFEPKVTGHRRYAATC